MKRVSRNLVAIVGSDVGRRAMGFFTVAYLARKLGTADFGIINIGFTVLSYAIMGAAGGLNAYGAREVAKSNWLERVNSLLSLRLASSAIAYGLVAFLAMAFITNELIIKVVLISSTAIFAHAVMLEWFFQGREAMGMIGVGRLVSAVVYLVLVLLLVHRPADLLWVAAAAVIGDFIAAAVMLAVYRKRYDARFSFETEGWLVMIRQSFRLGVGSMLGHFSIHLAPLAIGVMASTADVGVYSAAQRMVFFLLMVDRVVGTLLLPAAARLHSYSPQALSSALSYAQKWILVAALPLAAGGTILGDQIVRLVFGVQYLAAGNIFKILLWYFLLTMLHTIYTSGLVAIRQEQRYTRIMVISALVYASSILLLTSLFGATGTACAIVVSEGITMLLMKHECQKFVNITVPRSALRVFLAAAVMLLVLVGVQFSSVGLGVSCGGAVYIIVLFATRGVTRADVAELAARIA